MNQVSIRTIGPQSPHNGCVLLLGPVLRVPFIRFRLSLSPTSFCGFVRGTFLVTLV